MNSVGVREDLNRERCWDMIGPHQAIHHRSIRCKSLILQDTAKHKGKKAATYIGPSEDVSNDKYLIEP